MNSTLSLFCLDGVSCSSFALLKISIRSRRGTMWSIWRGRGRRHCAYGLITAYRELWAPPAGMRDLMRGVRVDRHCNIGYLIHILVDKLCHALHIPVRTRNPQSPIVHEAFGEGGEEDTVHMVLSLHTGNFGLCARKPVFQHGLFSFCCEEGSRTKTCKTRDR